MEFLEQLANDIAEDSLEIEPNLSLNATVSITERSRILHNFYEPPQNDLYTNPSEDVVFDDERESVYTTSSSSSVSNKRVYADSDNGVCDDESDANDDESDDENGEQNLIVPTEDLNAVYNDPPPQQRVVDPTITGRLLCSLCPCSFQTREKLSDHYFQTHGGLPSHDQNVDVGDTSNNSADGDEQSVEPDQLVDQSRPSQDPDHPIAMTNDGKLICPLCSKKLATQKTLINHFKRMHPNDPLPSAFNTTPADVSAVALNAASAAAPCRYQCALCASTLATTLNLLNHYTRVHPELPTPSEDDPYYFGVSQRLNCDLCTKTFANVVRLAVHYKAYHPTHIRTDQYKDIQVGDFKCTICDEPFRTQNQLDKHTEKAYCHRDWQKTPFPVTDIEVDPDRPHGPTDPSMADMTEVELFMHFFHPLMINNWLPHTNRKGEVLFGSIKYGKWKQLTFPEACRWLALYLVWGLCKTKTLRQPWNRKAVFSNDFFKQNMAGYRFEQVIRSSHFNDNNADQMHGQKGDATNSATYDRLYKISDMMETFFITCEKTWYPNRCISIDESMGA